MKVVFPISINNLRIQNVNQQVKHGMYFNVTENVTKKIVFFHRIWLLLECTITVGKISRICSRN